MHSGVLAWAACLLLICRHSGVVIMGQAPGNPPTNEALSEALSHLPPQWLQALRQALDLVESTHGGTWSASASGDNGSWTSSAQTGGVSPPAAPSPAASSSEQRVDTRTRRWDVPCGIPCTTCLVGYCTRGKRGHSHHNCTACERQSTGR